LKHTGKLYGSWIAIKLYHVTTPERAKAILEEGFNEDKNPNYHTKIITPINHRVFLCRKRDIPKWIRILSKEQGWKELTIIAVQIPKEAYHQLLTDSPWNEEERGYIDNYLWDWEDQLVFDTKECVKEGMFGIHLSIHSHME